MSADDLAHLRECVEHLAHRLPAQAPLRDFVHHNTLHAYQHLPFAQALTAAARFTGARPWLAEARCRELFRQGRIDAADLDAAMRQVADSRPDELLWTASEPPLRRADLLRALLLHQPAPPTAQGLRWLVEEQQLDTRLPEDLDPAVRRRLLAAAAADGLAEPELVADLWQAVRELTAARSADADADADAESARAAGGAGLWQTLLARLGHTWTIADLLQHLTGEDLRQALHAPFIRHLAAHLDRGLAAWANPAREQGFFAAWRASAGVDWQWELNELAWARREIAQLAADPWQTIADGLRRLAVDEACWPTYLQRLAGELPGWAGMCHWRATHPAANEPPLSLCDFLAVRVVLEWLYAEQLVRRIWGLPLDLAALGEHFAAHPDELALRHAYGEGTLPDEVLDALSPLLATAAGGPDSGWRRLAGHIAEAGGLAGDDGDAQARAAWPLFSLVLRLGLSGRELRAMHAAGAADRLLAGIAWLNDERRGLLWLLAYENHYRQQIFAALLANHGRAPALAGLAQAQFVFCMDDREEGTRRHLEEVDPAYETFGAAGFFGVPMLWQGLDDEAPTALCPIVVRPTNSIREVVGAGAAAAYERQQRRRKLRLRWQERLQQGTRRGGLLGAVLSLLAGPPALAALLARTWAPGRFAALLARRREAYEPPVAGDLQLTAEAGEATREADADAPRVGFSASEQVARVAGFLRTIGLTEHFAPLVAIVGHGSDSRNNPHLSAYDCGACSGRHGGPNARVFAALANLRDVRAGLAGQGIHIPEQTWFIAAEHNTCDESFVWYDLEKLPPAQRPAFEQVRLACQEATRRHAVERCRRFASAPRDPSPEQALRHLADRRNDFGQARPELGHATVATAFVGRRAMSRGAFFDRRAFLISYDPLPDVDGRILEATLLAAGPVGAGINLEYYFSTVDNERFGCGSKIMHNLAGLFAVMQGAASDLRTGLPLQMVEIHEAMRLLVIVEQTIEILTAIYQRQPPLQELIGNGWILLAAKHPQRAELHVFDPASGWTRALPTGAPADSPSPAASPVAGASAGWPALPEVDTSTDWFAGQREPLPPALLRRPLASRAALVDAAGRQP
ncbi:MAG TPA: DUF2309 domain-containing protein [Accumulibacter sp.]|uniref:DUF2309 domain-containing protein n=1 Tax=Accumulibacter sp. TaxID=2053492 RepID=UPI002C12E57B|nr:DUF2309 domain-containing protein [Accumulibacter sp.]HNN84845.1 DUF2309 domain-containing protein [Accumulibacter sp.]